MKRRLLIMTVTALVALAVTTGAAVTSDAATKTKTVTITGSHCAGGKEFCFGPATLTIARGTKVMWHNATAAPHTVTRCTKSACGVSGGTGTDLKFGSTIIDPAKSYTFTFAKAGTYIYYCTIHGYALMHGTITVH